MTAVAHVRVALRRDAIIPPYSNSSSKMKLIGSLTSPYARKARIVLAEKKIEYEFVLDNPWQADSGVARFNPLGKVPVLVLDDEFVLPASGRERIRVKRWEARADGVLDAAVAVFLEEKRPTKERSADWIARQREKIDRALETMSEDLGEQPWCGGNAFSLADVAVGTALGYLAFRLPDIAWRTRHANLARLYEDLMARPSFADTIPQG